MSGLQGCGVTAALLSVLALEIVIVAKLDVGDVLLGALAVMAFIGLAVMWLGGDE
jgi:hypothetical protein